MIVYHGTPMGGDRAGVTRFLSGRHALIPFPRQEDVATAADVCQTFCFDNGAFSAWRKGKPVEDWSAYYEWCEEWHRHPGFAWAIIPDVIDGSEADNDELIDEWPSHVEGVPVWHLHESFERLDRLCHWPRLSIGSSGEYAQTGTPKWWQQMRKAMKVICDERGRPRTRLHGLRMACKEYTSRFPFASVDSTNVAQNKKLRRRFGTYPAPTGWQNAEQIAAGMEYPLNTAEFDMNWTEDGDLFALSNDD
tara:strand:+ start:292 stop:1038 length:747 start_codon:yes stop_codon:yes gene_type:complete